MTRQQAMRTVRDINQLIEWEEKNLKLEEGLPGEGEFVQDKEMDFLANRLADSGFDYEDLVKNPIKIMCCECCGKGLEKEAISCKICHKLICESCNRATLKTGPVCHTCDSSC